MSHGPITPSLQFGPNTAVFAALSRESKYVTHMKAPSKRMLNQNLDDECLHVAFKEKTIGRLSPPEKPLFPFSAQAEELRQEL